MQMGYNKFDSMLNCVYFNFDVGFKMVDDQLSANS